MRTFARFISTAVYWLVSKLFGVAWTVFTSLSVAVFRLALRAITLYCAAVIFIWSMTAMLQ